MVDSIRVFDPGFRVLDTSGNPVSGAKCKFYNAGGLVARTVFSDADLSVSLGSTVTCNSGGSPAASGGSGGQVLIYTGTTAYKLVITDSNDDPLYEFDDISGAIDTSGFEASTALPRTPVEIKSTNYSIVAADRAKVFNVDSTGGNVAITLPSAVTVGDNWRVTVRHNGTANSVTVAAAGGQTVNGAASLTLSYQFEAVTLVSDGANWHVAEDAFVRYPAGTVTPQGYLTLTSGVPIILTDVSAAAALYYTPFTGNLVPIYSGTRFVPYEFSELSLTLVSQHVANTIYDVFAFLDGSTLRIGTGPAWVTSTAGSGARGSGAGTSELARLRGIRVNAVQITARNGTDTYTVAANKATCLGSIFMDGTNGQLTCHRSYGQSRKWGISNAYNRVPVYLKAGDATASWSYSTATTRPSNNSTANSLTIFDGFAEDVQYITHTQLRGQTNNTAVGGAITGIGYNSTTAMSGVAGQFAISIAANPNTTQIQFGASDYTAPPKLGVNVITSLENGGGNSATWYGTEERMMLKAMWKA